MLFISSFANLEVKIGSRTGKKYEAITTLSLLYYYSVIFPSVQVILKTACRSGRENALLPVKSIY